MFTLEQIFLSIILNAAALVCTFALRTAPPRVVLYVCLLGMLAILIPWSYIGTELQGFVPEINMIEPVISIAASPPLSDKVTIVSNYQYITAAWIVIGLVWLVVTLLRYTRIKNAWRENASCGMTLLKYGDSDFKKILHRIHIYRLPNSSLVFASGVWRPEIWIGDNIDSATQIEAAVNHELAHIEANDQLVLFLIVALERLLWWNSLIWLLGRQARRHMEYAADARCQSLIGGAEYRHSLAELFLKQQPRTSTLELTLGNKSDTITRLEKIEMKHIIKPSHLVTLAIAGSLTAIASTSLADQSNSEQTTLIECHELLPDGVQYDFRISSEIDTREGEKGHLSVSLIDPAKPESRDVPSGANEFLQCVQKVVGVGNDKGWPES